MIHMRMLLVALLGAMTAAGQQAPIAGSAIDVTRDVMVTMRDGVKLATDIYRPAGGGRFPVLLTRTPYNKETGADNLQAFAARGYVVVVQDVRGRYHSEGHWVPIRDDPNDGFDTAKWIGAQEWYDVGIGTFGSSYN